MSTLQSITLWRSPVVRALMCAALTTAAWAQSPPDEAAGSERASARAAVERYFRAADSGNAQAVRQAFLPTGRVEGVAGGVGGGKFLSWSAEEFATRNFKGQPPANVAAIQRTVEWLDVSGPGAVARVKIVIEPSSTYHDYFVLFKLDGEWKIGLKAFANP